MVAGGTESMSLIPMGGHTVAPNPALVDSYPDVYLSTGLVAENHARQSGISREAQDAFALRQPRARHRRHRRRTVRRRDRAGHGARDATPSPTGGAPVDRARSSFDTDEGPRRDTSLEALGKLAPAFHAPASVTAGNSSQTSDGAAALVLVVRRSTPTTTA